MKKIILPLNERYFNMFHIDATNLSLQLDGTHMDIKGMRVLHPECCLTHTAGGRLGGRELMDGLPTEVIGHRPLSAPHGQLTIDARLDHLLLPRNGNVS